MRKILIAGGSSDIARCFARRAAEHGDALVLVGRSAVKLEATAADLRTRGAHSAQTFVMDLRDTARLDEMIAFADRAMAGLDTVFVAHGTLTGQSAAEKDSALIEQDIATNFTSAAVLLARVATLFEERGRGAIGVITSVAGERGRGSNYIYGAAKAGLIAFVAGLRARLFRAGVTVTDIRPGFVDSNMTSHLPKTMLFAKSDAVGRHAYDAVAAGRDVVYTPWFWRWIMLVLKAVPETVFKRLRI
jgi:decaprenylphospho-beta-D-erythro-pentofuranosid-2-ulose 2-reductase